MKHGVCLKRNETKDTTEMTVMMFNKTRTDAHTKGLTRGRANHFATDVAYLHFPIQVCFSDTFLKLVFPILLSLSAEKGTSCCYDFAT